MAPRLPKSGSEKPQATRVMQSQYRNICACGRTIARGELIFYDRYAKVKVRCMPCGNRLANLAQDEIAEIAQPPEVDRTIERIRQLQALPVDENLQLQKEFAHHLWMLRENHTDQTTVRKLFVELARCRVHGGVEVLAFRAKYPGNCLHCNELQKVGSLILYDKNHKKIHCLFCEVPWLVRPNKR